MSLNPPRFVTDSVGVHSIDNSSVQREILSLIVRQTRRVPLPVFISMAVLATIAAQHVPLWMAGTWLAAEAAVMAFRYKVLSRLDKRTDIPMSRKFSWLIGLNLLSATLHASSLVMFPLLAEAERAFFTVLLLGLCSGAVASMAGSTRALLAFIGPILVVLAFVWAWTPGVLPPSSVERVIALLILGYGCVVVAVGQDVNRSVVDAWSSRQRERRLNDRLTEALTAAEEAGRTKARFLTAAGHDLNQPLAVINTVTATLSLRSMDAQDQRALDVLSDASRELSSQIKSLIDTCRLDTGKLEVHRKKVDLSALVHRHAEEVALQAAAKGLEWSLVCSPDVVIQTDPALLLRVLRNLTDNAVKYTDAGRITLRMSEESNGVVIAVEDTGRGIASDQHTRVFEEFYQVNPGQDVPWTGLGLGLSIVKRLAFALGIRIELRSALGVGSAFVLHLSR